MPQVSAAAVSVPSARDLDTGVDMTLQNAPLALLVSTAASLVSGLILLAITRRAAKGDVRRVNETPPPDGQVNVGTQGASRVGSDSAVIQIRGDGNHVVGPQSTTVHYNGTPPSSDPGSSDGGMVTAGIAVIVAATIMAGFVRHLDWVMAFSLTLTTVPAVAGLVLLLRTCQSAGRVPFAARAVLVEVAVAVSVSAAVWVTAFNVDYQGVTLAGASDVAREMKDDPAALVRWFPIGHLLDVYGTDSAVLVCLGAGVIFSILLMVLVARSLADWFAYLRCTATPNSGEAMKRRAASFASEGWADVGRHALVIGVSGAIALLFSSAVPLQIFGQVQ